MGRGETSYSHIVGAVIANLRENQDVNQRTLATRIDMTRSGVSKIERGETSVSVERLHAIGEAIDSSAGHILALADIARLYALAHGLKVLLVRNSKSHLTREYLKTLVDHCLEHR